MDGMVLSYKKKPAVKRHPLAGHVEPSRLEMCCHLPASPGAGALGEFPVAQTLGRFSSKFCA